MIEANWPIVAVAVLAVLIVAWLLLRRGSTRAAPRAHRPDVLDEGVGPAQRNQALIDAPSAADAIQPPPASIGMAGIGEAIAVAAQDEVEAAEAAAPAPVPEPAPEPAPAPASIGGDDLSRIKGLGPKLQALLPTLGLATYAEIAALSEADLDALDAKLGAFAGRPRRDSWVEQAKLLSAGDVGGFEAKFGKV